MTSCHAAGGPQLQETSSAASLRAERDSHHARRARVVFLSHTFRIGGAEEMVLNLVRNLPADRYAPMVCCIQSPGPIGIEIRATRTPLVSLGLEPGLRHPLAVLTIARYLRDVQPDIVHTFLLTASLYGRLAAIMARVPIIIGSEVNVYERKRRRHILAERLLMKRTDSVVASARSVKEHYLRQIGAESDRVDVIYNAVDFDRLRTSAPRETLRSQLGLAHDAMVIGVIARLTEQKGHQYLLEALARTPNLKSAHLVVIGDGEIRGRLEQQIGMLGLSQRVTLLGGRRDLGDLLSVMDIFVMPSLWEGLPLSLILAMGAGLPVVATAVAGIPEVIEDGVTGLLVPPGDAVALGGALVRVASDAHARTRLGRAARELVLPRFGVDGYVRAVTHLYDRLLAAKLAPDHNHQSPKL